MLFRKKLSIKYVSFNVNEYANFLPAKNIIPKWFKEIKAFPTGYPPKDVSSFRRTVKTCIPFLDALTSGYLITTSYDIVVTQENGSPVLSWPEGGSLVEVRDNKYNEAVPVPVGHSPVQFIWKIPVSTKVPKEYSILFTHPFNRFDLPFTSLSGIVDGDYALIGEGKYPFFIKEGFEGLIPQGTPIVQCLPFKNESWKSVKDESLRAESRLMNMRASSILTGFYKKTFWQKKYYE